MVSTVWGGAINKVEKIMRHAGFTGRVIRAFCQEAFRLALLEFRPPDWYQFVGKNNRLILRMTTDDFPVWVSEPDVGDF